MEGLSVIWLLVAVVAFVAFGLAIAYGMKRNRERTGADEKVTEAATRAEYKRDA